MHEELDKRKVIGTVIGIIVFLCCIVFFTYAWYEWRSTTNTSVVLTIQDASTICEIGPSVNVENIGPVLDYNDGVSATFSVQNQGEEDLDITLGLNITSIDEELLVSSFKYILLKSSSAGYVATNIKGDFSNFTTGNNNISNNVEVSANSTTDFKFIVYIDGSMYNNPDMMSASMNSNLVIGNCDSINTSLSNVEVGSYIAYTGNNGCTGASCNGQNANYVSDSNMGYCNSSSYKFTVNGWRVMSKDSDGVYLVSAGATDCMCTNSDGTASSTSCSSYLSADDLYKHFDNMNALALKYCNTAYAKGGVCNSSTAWAMSGSDYEKVTGSTLSTCNLNKSETCGLNNNLIDNGSYYWFTTRYSSSASNSFYWRPNYRFVGNYDSHRLFGLRPVLYLDSSILVTGGSGTYTDPYTLKEPKTLSDIEVGSYIAYTGNNGCTGASCNGQNANYVSDSNMGYCYSLSYKFTVNGWRVMSKDSDGVYLVSAGATDCMCTNSDGTASSTSCSSYLSSDDLYKHFDNMNALALKYCNTAYAKGGVCNSTTAWAMNGSDFEKITGSTLNTCYGTSSEACGLNNTLIDNGGLYWYATRRSSSSSSSFDWSPDNRHVYDNDSDSLFGLRPVLNLDSSILITGGSGTYEDPYTLAS